MKLDYLKTLSVQACGSLAEIESEHTHLQRQFRCGEYLRYVIGAGGSMHLNRANWCKQRTCAVCCWLRSTKYRLRIFQGLPGLLRDYCGYHFLFLTLTVRNCHISELRSHIRMMESGWHRMVNLQRFPAVGFLKSVEVSRPRDCFYHGVFVGRMGQKLIDRWLVHLQKLPSWNPSAWREYHCEECHPHFHALLMVSPSYFHRSEKIEHAEWRSLWKRAARLDYEPILDIRRVNNLSGAILEVSKYCLKSEDMIDVLGCLTIRQLHNLRLFSVSGAFTDYFSQAAIDAIADTAELGTEHWQQGMPCHYQWDGEEYVLTRLGDSEWQLV